MNPKLSKYITGFQKNHYTQHALLKMIETLRSKLNCGNKIVALIIDLSKAFDILNHDLFLSNLKAYVNSMIILFCLFEAYLQTSTKKPKLAALSVTVTKSLLGSSGVSIFNIFINDLFLFANKSVICNYAVDNTLYSANKNISQVISHLSNGFEISTKWFYDNYMVLNPYKCHFMTLGFQDQTLTSIKKIQLLKTRLNKKYLELL